MENFSGKSKGGKLAIIVPGFLEGGEGRHGSFRLLSSELAKRGISSLRLSLGYSPPEIYSVPLGPLEKEAEKLASARERFEKNFEKIFLVGVSMGGIVSQIELSKNPKKYAGAVFWYSPTKVPEGSLPNPLFGKKEGKKIEEMGCGEFLKPNTNERFFLGNNYLSEIKKLDTEKFALKIKIPSLILHPKNDSIVPFSEGERLFRSLKGANRALVPMEGDHGWWNLGRTAPDRIAQAKAIKLTCEWILAH